MNTRTKLAKIQEWMDKRFIERADLSEALVLAALTREHVLALGPVGTAKSEQAEHFARVVGASLFHQQLHPLIQLEDVFGPIDMSKFEKTGVWERSLGGYLPTAEIAILEEIDKAGPSVYSPLLTVLNERKYRHGASMIDIPLMFVVGNCNATLDDSTSATWDRFLIRVQVNYIQDPAGFMRLLDDDLRTDADPETVTAKELAEAQAEVSAVEFTDAAKQAMTKLRDDLRGCGIIPGDRRFRKARQLVKANAWLRGSATAEVVDLAVLRHALWLSPEQRPAVADVVWEVSAPALRRVLEIDQIVHSVLGEVASNNFANRDEQNRWAINARKDLTALYKELANIRSECDHRGETAISSKALTTLDVIPGVIARIMFEVGLVGSADAATQAVRIDLASA